MTDTATLNLDNPETLRLAIKTFQEAATAADREAERELAEAERHRDAGERKRREAETRRKVVAGLAAQLELLTGESVPVTAEEADAAPTASEVEPEPEPKSKRRRRIGHTAGDDVLEAVTRIGEPVRIADVHAQLPDLARKTVGWWLWKLADEGQLKKIKQGLYAPASYTPDELSPATIAPGDPHQGATP